MSLYRQNNLDKKLFFISLIMILIFNIFSISLSIGDDNMKKSNYENSINSSNNIKFKKIYFAHQSVGKNILSGLQKVIEEKFDKNDFSIYLLKDNEKFEHPGITHEMIGQNEKPFSKIEDFKKRIILNRDNIDIAMLKFCFVDINNKTNIKKLFEEYQKMTREINEKAPAVQLIHFTVPLLENKKKSVIQTIKEKLFKKEVSFFDISHNIARNEYNKMLLENFIEDENVFDIAKIEASSEDGNIISEVEYNGEKYLSLSSKYSSDGGHLNDNGSEIVAVKLFDFINNIK